MSPQLGLRQFERTITITPAMTDAFGHVNNVAYVQLIQDIAVAHSDAVGLSWAQYQSLGAGFVVRRHSIEYLRPVRVGERLSLRTWIESFTRITAERSTDFVNQQQESVLTASTTWVYVSLATLRPVRAPELVRNAFALDQALRPFALHSP